MFDGTGHHSRMLSFFLQGSSEVLEAVLTETHFCSCLSGRDVVF